MNIDNLLNLNSAIHATFAGREKIRGKVVDILEEETFVFLPDEPMDVKEGDVARITDGQDSALAKVMAITPEGISMCVECYASPGDERRQDARVYDKVYFTTRLLCHADRKHEILQGAVERIQANNLIIESFLKGKYGPPNYEEIPFTRESIFNHPIIWEINRKLDLLIHMYLAEDFMALMKAPPKDVNISASGIRFITSESFAVGDLLEIGLILPVAPLLFLRLVGDVLRIKPVTSYETERYAVAVRFLKVDPDTKEDIIKYLFRRQRGMLRKRQL